MPVRSLTADLTADVLGAFDDVVVEAQRIYELEFTVEERAAADESPDDLRAALMSLAPVLARTMKPELHRLTSVALSEGASRLRERGDVVVVDLDDARSVVPAGGRRIEREDDAVLEPAELSRRVRSLEGSLRAVGAWLSTVGPLLFAAVVLSVALSGFLDSTPGLESAVVVAPLPALARPAVPRAPRR